MRKDKIPIFNESWQLKLIDQDLSFPKSGCTQLRCYKRIRLIMLTGTPEVCHCWSIHLPLSPGKMYRFVILVIKIWILQAINKLKTGLGSILSQLPFLVLILWTNRTGKRNWWSFNDFFSPCSLSSFGIKVSVKKKNN